MTDPVALPFWIFAAMLILAASAALEHLLMPALRWMLAHAANHVMDELSTRLRIGIRPFQRTRRHRPSSSPSREAFRCMPR